MLRSVARSLLVAAVTIAIAFAAHALYFAAVCPAHRAWTRVSSGQTRVILDGGYGVPRPGDTIFACTMQHCFAAWCHTDAHCFCASGLFPSGLAHRVDPTGVCHPDDGTACPSHCERHFDP
jgi:hypothetical protein